MLLLPKALQSHTQVSGAGSLGTLAAYLCKFLSPLVSTRDDVGRAALGSYQRRTVGGPRRIPSWLRTLTRRSLSRKLADLSRVSNIEGVQTGIRVAQGCGNEAVWPRLDWVLQNGAASSLADWLKVVGRSHSIPVVVGTYMSGQRTKVRSKNIDQVKEHILGQV